MKKLKELLSESYAWDKKPGKPLPTLSEVQAEYERKMAEEEAKPDFLDLDKDGNTKEPMRNAGKEMNEGGDTDNVLHLVSQAEDMVQNLRKNMSTNSVLRLEEKMGYLNAYNELLDILSDIALEVDRE